MSQSKDDTQFEGTGRVTTAEGIDALDEAWPVQIHIIPQAHIDLAWQWTAEDAVEMVLETFRAHADLLEADGNRTFAQSQLAAYEIVEHEDPELFARIRNLIERGQWEVVGGEWVEPDRGIPGGEALIRQLLEGQYYAQEKLGVRAKVAWSPDSFTWHPPNLPQILRSGGLTFQAIKRPREKYVSLPLVPFRWRGLDGTELVTYRTNNKGSGLPILSEGTPEPADGRTHLAEYWDAFHAIDFPHMWGPRGVGDTGGVNEYPEPASGPGWSSSYSTPSKFTDALAAWGRESDLPVVEGAIGPMMPGCLTTHHEMKSLNRKAENALQSAETTLSIAAVSGADIECDDARSRLREAWKRVLFNQFHDTVTGVGIPAVHSEAAHDYQEAINIAERVRRTALRSISRAVTSNDKMSVLVTNDLGWKRSDVVHCEIDLGPAPEEEMPSQSWEAVAPDGTTSPVTIHGIKRAQQWTRHQCSFIARDMPGMGWRTYQIRKPSRVTKVVRTSGTEIMSDHFTMRIDPTKGTLAMLMNRTDAVSFRDGLGQPRLHEEGNYFLDYGVEHRAWYLGLTGEEKPVTPLGVRVVDDLPAYAAVEARHRFGESEICQRYIVRPDLPYVEVQVEIDWHEIEHLVRLHFAPGIEGENVTASFDTAYAVHDKTPDGEETPMQMFCGLSNGVEGLGILNDGRYGAMADDKGITLSAVRCSTRPDPRSDEGRVTFRYALVPHVGSWREGDLPRLAYGFNRPLLGFPIDSTDTGSNVLPEEGSVVESKTPSVLPVVMKHTHSGSGHALRVYHASDVPGTATVDLGAAENVVTSANVLEDRNNNDAIDPADTAMRPFEIATWLIDSK
jgi:alpha-mannosidase